MSANPPRVYVDPDTLCSLQVPSGWLVDTSGQQNAHEHCSNCLRNQWQDGTCLLSSRKRAFSILLPSPAQQHHCL